MFKRINPMNKYLSYLLRILRHRICGLCLSRNEAKYKYN